MTQTAGRFLARSRVPVVQGGAGFGGLYEPIDDDAVQRALQTAWEGGVRAFDTAPHYGVGVSEERLGRFLAGQPREQYTLSTKVGRLLVDDPEAPTQAEGYTDTPRRRRVRDYSADGVRRSLDDSLRRLGLDRLDLVLIHDPEEHLDDAVAHAAPALSALRDQGVIGGYGVGTNYAETALRLVRETDLDTVMIAGRYTLLDRTAAQELLPAAAERGVTVLTAGVLNSGLLVDPYAPEPYFDYEPAPEVVVAKAQRLQQTCARYGVELRAAALQFPLRHPATSAVVIGARTAAAVADTLNQLETHIPPTLWAELDDLASTP